MTTTPAEAGVTSDKNNPRELFGWKMYDWANSAFYTTVVGALFSPYLTRLAQTAVGENGVVLDLGPLGAVTAKSLPTLCVSISVGAQVFLLPILGALGDYSDLKKRMMAVFCYIAVIANCLMFFVKDDLYLLGGVLFIVANVCFGAALVFYNAFLPEIATEDQADKVSSRGFAYGYLGGAILLVLNLLLVLKAEELGMSTGMAVRLSLLSAGIWWGGFALITFALLKSRPKKKSLPPGKSYISAGFSEIVATFKELRRLPLTARYLLGYLIYNDGIQTVIFASSAFLEQELFPGGQSRFPARDLSDGPICGGGGRAPLRTSGLSHQDEERDHRVARDLVWNRDLCESLSGQCAGSVGHGSSHRDRVGRFAGAFTFALLAHDSGGQGSFVLWALRGFRTRHFMDGTTTVQHRDCAHRFLPPGVAVVDLLLRGWIIRVVDDEY